MGKDVKMSCVSSLTSLETARLTLRSSVADDAAVYRQLWTERDPRVPPHRQIDSEGQPTVEVIAEQILANRHRTGPRLLAVERKSTGDIIGYCGLILGGNGSADEPALAYEIGRAHV